MTTEDINKEIERLNKLRPIVKAYEEGKTIEFEMGGRWMALFGLAFDCEPDRYRIKPEPKTVPLTTHDLKNGDIFQFKLDSNVWHTHATYVKQGENYTDYSHVYTQVVPVLVNGVDISHDTQVRIYKDGRWVEHKIAE